MEKLEEHREARIPNMWNEYEITPNNALQYKKEELTDLNAMKRDIAQVKDEIRKLGNVNVNAIEEYKEISERHAFLSGQYEDLKTAEAQLENIIQELDEGNAQAVYREISRISRRNLTRHSRSCLAEERVLWSLRRMWTFWKLASVLFPSLRARSSRI